MSRSASGVKLMSRSSGTSRAHSADDVARPVACDHSDDDPTQTLEHFQSPNVPGVLPAIAAVLITVILDRNFQFLPAHIEVSHRLTEVIGNRDLRVRWW